MTNLLRAVLALAEDPRARREFRADPSAMLGELDGLCGEDVAAVLDVVRVQVQPTVAARLTDAIGGRTDRDDQRAVVVDSLLAVCDAVEAADAPTIRSRGGDPVPGKPPGPRATHLWAVDGSGERSRAPGGRFEAAPLASVPDPPGGFEFAPLELVVLPDGLGEHGIEPGALATVVAVHRQPELHYEIEVSSADGARRFLGTVAPAALGPYAG